MIKGYKLKRELLRIARKPKQLKDDALTFLFGARYYDRFLADQCRVQAGVQEMGQNVAVYLIYPSRGLKPSHLRTLRYLHAKNYSVIVVSNLPLEEAEVHQILPLSHRYIQRPNFGYDFGGYRDGVLSVLSGPKLPERLVLLNDSAWFPISDATDWLDDVAQLDVDFAAAASNYGVPRPDPEDFRNMVFDYRSDHKRFHYCSFALAFGSRILRDLDFKKFWERFPLSNEKTATVRRGEVGLTAWVLRKGYLHGATFDMASLERCLNGLSDARLRQVIEHLIVPADARMKETLSRSLADLEDLSREDRIKLVLTTIARQGVSYATAYFNMLEQGFPFLKKSPVWLDEQARERTLNILDTLGTPAAIEAKAEALEIKP
ncbi:hypothetical protein ROLI_045880 (plasmid) [Roseobacter fucihabitans]|uniref:Rhamnan synthesis protein F n=1 Tax=Roseobacter fucihabitans TaxID=1537242 RepID=A0ABZ2C0C0_9RHOB|nr:rhamnan synthesis F family protein [Roseobacter litoralis]MBC6967595.1 Rhamnan synthesis protein F [Roseobacter litoralis]